MNKPLMTSFAATVIFLAACNGESDVAELDAQSRVELEIEEIVENLQMAGYPDSEIEVTADNTVMVGGDAVVTLAASREIAGKRQVPALIAGDDDFRHYSTNNLVSTPRVISVIGYTGGSNALDSTMQSALQMAVENYNALDLDLEFTLSFSTSTSADIVVYKVNGGGGGSAGFPSGGNPYKWVQIQSGTSNYGTNVVEHVITHEIGHAIGFRHTDYFNRSLSCGTGGSEGDGGVGANHVPGTPTGFDANSIMLSCFSANEDGEFGNYDIVALDYLYGASEPEPEPEPASLCEGLCGQNAGSCWCDSQCAYYGDCCPGKVEVCG